MRKLDQGMIDIWRKKNVSPVEEEEGERQLLDHSKEGGGRRENATSKEK